jgi:pantetheine-phosphate adenylyltransferase
MSDSKIHTAFFPGSFNPFTIGHASIVDRALEIFDNVIIGVGVSAEKPATDIAERITAIKRCYEDNPRVTVISYTALTAVVAKQIGASAIVRGVRSVKDFEYERDMADINRRINGMETVLFYSLPELSAISSSVVRELSSYGVDPAQFLPDKH